MAKIKEGRLHPRAPAPVCTQEQDAPTVWMRRTSWAPFEFALRLIFFLDSASVHPDAFKGEVKDAISVTTAADQRRQLYILPTFDYLSPLSSLHVMLQMQNRWKGFISSG